MNELNSIVAIARHTVKIALTKKQNWRNATYEEKKQLIANDTKEQTILVKAYESK